MADDMTEKMNNEKLKIKNENEKVAIVPACGNDGNSTRERWVQHLGTPHRL
ncbi:MAG: hypothetical protein IJ615_05085 [Bacteroidaceae bacterium]|nr:hypothetical protein [Bacteroidaceae bacterium]